MKSIRYWFIVAAAIGSTYSTSRAQLLVLTGNVTSANGIYESKYHAGDSVSLSFNFTNASYVYLAPDRALYYPSAVAVSISGSSSLWPVGRPEETYIFDQPDHEGLKFGVSNIYSYPGGVELLQNLLSAHDVVSSTASFPAGIPMDLFYATDGSFGDYYVGEHAEKFYLGGIYWEITQYTGSVEILPLRPVPEPATYGTIGSLALLGLAAVRKFKRKRVEASALQSAAAA